MATRIFTKTQALEMFIDSMAQKLSGVKTIFDPEAAIDKGWWQDGDDLALTASKEDIERSVDRFVKEIKNTASKEVSFGQLRFGKLLKWTDSNFMEKGGIAARCATAGGKMRFDILYKP